MKLNKENFTKTQVDAGMLYQYICNETNFFLLVEGKGGRKKISVFKGSLDAKEEEFNTTDSLEAWNHFEEMLKVCEPQQGSSGGFKKNPQETPDILPLLAIKQDGDLFNVVLFGNLTTGEQITAFDFNVSSDALTYPFPNKVFTVDWSNEEIPALVKCEVILKLFPDVKFKEDEERDVFVFIPKSIIQQGGEKGGEEGGEEGGDEGGDEDGEPKEGKGEPKDKDGKPKKDNEKPDDKTDGKTPSDEDEEPKEDENPDTPSQSDVGKASKYRNEEPPTQSGDDDAPEINFPEAVKAISQISGIAPSTIVSMRTPRNLEAILVTSNFSEIKRALNLPSNTTPSQLSQQIFNSRNQQ